MAQPPDRSPDFVDDAAPPPAPGEIRADATIIEGVAHNGKPCRIVDNTASVDPTELRELLDTLIRDRRFGLQGLSVAGSDRISIDQPIGTHIQLGEDIYRILMFPYEARIERF
ncbi:MAG: hypothetical protein P8009_06995 [Gammaproteobacteria bacterium]